MPRLTRHAKQELVQERQQQILQAAAQVFSEKGFDAATIRDVARAAGVSEGSIYLYFKNKQDLLVHLPRQFILPPVEAFRAALDHSAAPPSPEILLSSIARHIVNAVTHNRDLMRVLFTSLPTMDRRTRATYMREGPLYAVEMIEAYLRAQQAAGIMRANLDAAIAARTLPGMMLFFLLVQEILMPEDAPRYEYEKIIPNVIAIFLSGVMNDSNSRMAPTTKHKSKPKSKTQSRTARKQTIAIE